MGMACGHCIWSMYCLFNGPLFRRFTYRQCAITGAVLIFIGLLATVRADSFILYLLTISVIYGFGRSLMVSSSNLAVNTYFKKKRRTAMSYKFTVGGFGPIVLPYLSTFLINQYNVAGAVLFYSALSLHNLACAFIYQPVKWHVKKLKENPEAGQKVSEKVPENDELLETPMMPKTQEDGWFGSKKSLNGSKVNYKILDGTSENLPQETEAGKPLSEELPSKELSLPSEEKKLLEKSDKELDNKDQEEKKPSICERISIFFDLDLLKDFTFVNLAMGLTVINFTESNIAILTPFILSDFGFDNSHIAAAMSMLAVFDLGMRFLIPFITGRMKFGNKVFFLGGIIGMALGRVAVAHSRNFTVILIAFAWIGLCKALMVIFYNLIIPGYVPLKRLPAAAGLQLLLSGIFTLTCGPIIGLVRDATNYIIVLHWMNAMCFMVVTGWLLEDLYKQRKRKREKEQADQHDRPTQEAK
ncbi:uncharacterized protein LOC129911457 isoform X2 [Episyrphus balteatus]|uniref:uncharacterized protein LOC129911457 isoform X2 n=1 Tax=Episyrphus balteatus TaxID=286459 RepID=UPI002485A264|nr:uncharacterized protein LOC129911457 isoform X2 [Episyrphus balteatus]